MKKVLFNTRMASFALVLSLAVAVATPALANNGENPSGVQLKFIGNLKNQPVFQLSFASAVESEYTVTVRDHENNILYKDVVKPNSNNKFLLHTEELGEQPVTFEIGGKKAEKSVVFEVNKNSRTIQDVVVSQVR